MNESKFLIVLAYYKRPKIVLNALHSIKNLKYDNWELVFIDDSGNDDFKSTFFDYGLDKNKIKYVSIFDTDEQKLKQGGSRHGYFMNEAIKQSDADYTTILCDDDALVDNSFSLLNDFFKQHSSLDWCYNRVYFYDPEKEFYTECDKKTKMQQINYKSFYDLNDYNEPLSPQNKVDGSQVVYKNELFKKELVKYPYPKTMNLDSAILSQIYSIIGPCWPSYVYAQYKGAFPNQMGNRSEMFIRDN